MIMAHLTCSGICMSDDAGWWGSAVLASTAFRLKSGPLLLQMMGDMFSALTAAVGAADKVVELIQRRPEVGPTGKLQPSDFRGRLELDAVHFCYPARPNQKVLTGLTLEINPGEVRQGNRYM